MDDFKTQYEQFFSFSKRRLTLFEKNQVSNLIHIYLDSHDSRRELVGILTGLQYSLGMQQDQALSLIFEKDFDKNGNHIKVFKLLQSEVNEREKYNHNDFDHSTPEHLTFPLTDKLSTKIKQLVNSRSGSCLNDLWEKNQFTEKDISSFYKELKRNGCKRSLRYQLHKSLEIETSILFSNPLINYFFLAKPIQEPPSLRHYQKLTSTIISDSWITSQNNLFTDNYLESNRIVETEPVRYGNFFTENFIQSFVLHWKSLVPINSGKTVDDLISFHNSYTLYTLSLVLWSLGHRENNDPLCNLKSWDLDLKVAQINDKNSTGYEAHRIVPIPKIAIEQLQAYEVHLMGMAAALKTRIISEQKKFNNSQKHKPKNRRKKFQTDNSMAHYIKKVATGKEIIGSNNKIIKNPRYFFILYKSAFKKDFYKIKLTGITTNHLKSFQSKNDSTIPLNYSRRRYATLIQKNDPLSAIHAQLFLGHSAHRFINLNSSIEMSNYLNTVSTLIDKDMNQLGFELISGVRKSKGIKSLPKVKLAHDVAILSKKKLAHKKRKEKLKSKKSSIKQFNKSIRGFLKSSLNGSDIDSDTVNEFSESAKKIGAPSHPEWRELKGIEDIISDQDSFLAKVFKFRKFPIATNDIKEKQTFNCSQLLKAKSNFVTLLNKAPANIHLQEDPIAYIVGLSAISAVIFGGLACEESIKALLNTNHYTLYKTGGVIHIEFFVEKKVSLGSGEFEIEKLLFDRWLPDPISASILNYLTSKKAISNYDNNHEAMSRIMDNLGIEKQGNKGYKHLSKLASQNALLNIPIYQALVLSNTQVSKPLSQDCFTRIVINKKGILDQSFKKAYLPKDEASNNISKFKDAFSKCFEQVHSKNKGKTLNGELAKGLIKIIDDNPDIPFLYEMFFEWASFLCLTGSQGFGKEGQKYFAKSTLFGYISKTLGVFISRLKSTDISEWSTGQFDSFYKGAIAAEEKDSAKINLSRHFIRFHLFIENQYGVATSEWVNSRKSVIENPRPLVGRLVNKQEYFSALRMISELDESTDILEQAMFVAILMWNFGLRIGEAIRLRPKDIQDCLIKNTYDIIIKKTIHGDTKTKSSIRIVTGTHPLEPLEINIIDGLKSRTANESKIDPNVAICRKYYGSRDLVDQGTFTRIISYCLKNSSGDPFLRPHDMRHSFVSNLLVSGFQNVSNNHVKLSESWKTAFNEKSYFHQSSKNWKPANAALMVGHIYSATSFKWYAHIREFIDNKDYRFFNKINDSTVGFFLKEKPKSYSQKKRRAEKKHPQLGHDIVFEILSESDQLPSLENRKFRSHEDNAAFMSGRLVKNQSIMDIVRFITNNAGKWQKNSNETIKNHLLHHKFAQEIVLRSREFTKNGRLTEFSFCEEFNQTTKIETASIHRVISWFQKRSLLIHDILTDAKELNRIEILINSFEKMYRVKNSYSLVSLEKNDIELLKELLDLLDVELLDDIKITSTISNVAKKHNGKKDKNAANKLTIEPEIHRSGFEIILELPNEIVKMHTFLQVLFLVWLLVKTYNHPTNKNKTATNSI